MLIGVKVQNFKSFNDLTAFSMIASNKLRKQNDKWHSMIVFYSCNNMGLSISSMNNVLAALEETNTFEMPQDEDV